MNVKLNSIDSGNANSTNLANVNEASGGFLETDPRFRNRVFYFSSVSRHYGIVLVTSADICVERLSRAQYPFVFAYDCWIIVARSFWESSWMFTVATVVNGYCSALAALNMYDPGDINGLCTSV